MARYKPGKKETPEHKAARKGRKKAQRDAQRRRTLITPGTRTAENQLLQSRRWLLNERERILPRFSVDANDQVMHLFHKEPSIRAQWPFGRLSDEARRVVETLQNERDEAAAAGQHGDWWVGERRKGVGPEEQQTFKEARRLLKESGAGLAATLGVGVLGVDKEMEWADVGFEEDIEEADLAGLGDGGEGGEGKGGAEQGGVEGGRGVDLADGDEEMLEASEPVFAGEGVEDEELEGMDFD